MPADKIRIGRDLVLNVYEVALYLLPNSHASVCLIRSSTRRFLQV